MQIKEIINTLEEFAPLALQEDFDNAGVQVQSVPDEKVSGILLCLDVTEEVIDEAVRKNCNMIVSHHPLLFHSQKKITTNDYVGRCICKAIRNGVTLYAAHTNLDNAKGGVNFMMAEKMGLQNVRFLVPDVSGSGGSGIIGELPESMSKEKFVAEVRRIFRPEWHATTTVAGSLSVRWPSVVVPVPSSCLMPLPGRLTRSSRARFRIIISLDTKTTYFLWNSDISRRNSTRCSSFAG